jgi:hypothetical protein
MERKILVDARSYDIEYVDNYINQEFIYTCEGKKIGSITYRWLVFNFDHANNIRQLLAGRIFPQVFDLG